MSNLKQSINTINTLIVHHTVTNSAITNASVGWHLEHILLVINGIINALNHSVEADYKWRFNKNRSLIFLFKKIPRGKVKAPKTVTPSDEINEESLTNHLKKITGKLQLLDEVGEKKFFAHPFLGHLNKKHTIKFLTIHTKHHLKIIEEVLGK